MTTDLTAARRSTRRYNNATDGQRRVWRSHLAVLLVARGMSPADGSYAAQCGDAWDGMDTPSTAAMAILASPRTSRLGA